VGLFSRFPVVDVFDVATFVGVLPPVGCAVEEADTGLSNVLKYAPAELDQLSRQMPVRDAHCCVKCNERRPDNAQEERSHLATLLLS
jgi:hypothetical protein